MTEPTTHTGKRLYELLPNTNARRVTDRDILAIEQEAAQQERERLRAVVLAEEDVHERAARFTLAYILDLLADPDEADR